MAKTVLLMVRTPSVAQDVQERLHMPEFRLLAGHTLDDLKQALASEKVDHVIFGGGLDIETRLDMVREVFRSSNSTTVHMNSPSGPETFFPFVKTLLSGLRDT